MIPIKKLKAKIFEEFDQQRDSLRKSVMEQAFDTPSHYLTLPWKPVDNVARVELRWNIKKADFDRIDFHAYGKDHRISL